MSTTTPLALGLDFGTTSVRALLVDLQGNEHGSAVANYTNGQITKTLPVGKIPLPPDFALQHPSDWMETPPRRSAARCARRRPTANRSSAWASISPVARCCPPCAMDAALSAEAVREGIAGMAEALEASRGRGANRTHQSACPLAQGTVAFPLRRNHRPGVVLPQDARGFGNGARGL